MKHKKTVQERKCMVKHELSADMSHVTMTIYKRKSAGRKNNNIDLNVTFIEKRTDGANVNGVGLRGC